eukprot:1739798-Amphidinium_carterae.1
MNVLHFNTVLTYLDRSPLHNTFPDNSGATGSSQTYPHSSPSIQSKKHNSAKTPKFSPSREIIGQGQSFALFY